MEYIEGKNLKSLLAERAPFSYDQIAEMIAQVAEAIDYAHRKGIIHRDVKPANIIITTDEKVKITDFGIAEGRLVEPDDDGAVPRDAQLHVARAGLGRRRWTGAATSSRSASCSTSC